MPGVAEQFCCHVQVQDEEKQQLARESVAWALRNRQLAQMFPLLQQAPAEGSSAAASATSPGDAATGAGDVNEEGSYLKSKHILNQVMLNNNKFPEGTGFTLMLFAQTLAIHSCV